MAFLQPAIPTFQDTVMSDCVRQQIRALAESGGDQWLKKIQHGIEKEGLRVDGAGRLAQTPHPEALGSALCHSRITTDYSEALLEFITPVFDDIDNALGYLQNLHHYAYDRLGAETIWAASMPCHLQSAAEIPIAHYGSSNIGKLKSIYRVGLEHRYGKPMQAIAGIHYNFSLPEGFWAAFQQVLGDSAEPMAFQSASYFSLIRNFRRYSWLLLYLFGSSPALSRSFLGGDTHQLDQLDADTLYAPYATSLRMSDLGYTNQAQASLFVCYNTLDNYIETLSQAIRTPYAVYENIGIKVGGEYRQLNSNMLQIENEYYSDIRPKRVTLPAEKPVCALRARGVEYIEVRSQDINPFLPLGIDATQARFIDTFLVYCLLADRSELTEQECRWVQENNALTARRGREPGLLLQSTQGPRSLITWGQELLECLQPVAELLDSLHPGGLYQAALEQQGKKLADPELTPSAQVLTALRCQGLSYEAFALAQSQRHQQALQAEGVPEVFVSELEEFRERSLKEQRALEQDQSLDFDTFLARFMAQ